MYHQWLPFLPTISTFFFFLTVLSLPSPRMLSDEISSPEYHLGALPLADHKAVLKVVLLQFCVNRLMSTLLPFPADLSTSRLCKIPVPVVPMSTSPITGSAHNSITRYSSINEFFVCSPYKWYTSWQSLHPSWGTHIPSTSCGRFYRCLVTLWMTTHETLNLQGKIPERS